MSVNRVLAVLAVALGVLAPLAGSPFRGGPDPDGAGRVRAVELATWIRDMEPGLRVLDLRDSASYAAMHIPLAERVPWDSLDVLRADTAHAVVVYADNAAQAATAWRRLRDRGYTRAHYLAGGVGEWLRDIINPMIAPDASAEQREAFRKLADLSHYFGGVPRVGTRSHTQDTRTELQRALRRGCAF